ncbi:secretory lipase [Trichoderma arundinaceum]|uniref:Secretory lipase n=1 Tax=Trichoderma arundinaceum TaxID=490622 RepID=A0A395NIX8_TRIAR|nr:secretory lipase [Trichoderma arundinaceum]
MKAASVALLYVAVRPAYGQFEFLPPQVPTTGWNSSFKFTPEQIELGKLSPELASSIEAILNFDRSQLAYGGPSQDSFYRLSDDFSKNHPHSPGQVLKVQEFTDPTDYNIPAQTALSRIIYTTTNLNGTLVPASACILWPYSLKEFGNSSKHKPTAKAPVVLWTHGTSGFFADGAPSAHRSLFYGDFVPFTLAQAGYVVVAPDYAGLGVATSWDGSYVPHQYLIREAGAADSLNAIRAAYKAFSDKITREYVVVGHSQGGSVAWGVSELLAQRPQRYTDIQSHHLGTIIFNSASNAIVKGIPQVFLPWIGMSLREIFPSFKLSDWLTPLGIARTKLLGEIQGGQFVSQVLLENATEIVNPSWNETWYAQAVAELVTPGKRTFKGPMILYEGTEDSSNGYVNNMAIFEDTCHRSHDGFEFVGVVGAQHFPTMGAARQKWQKWIEDRFEGTPVSSERCVKTELKSYLAAEQYQASTKSYLQWSGQPEWFYQLPAA